MARWDWYQTTLHGVQVDEIAAALVRAFDLSDLRPARGMHGYSHGAQVMRGDRVLARIWWGQNPGVNVTGSGENAPTVAGVVAQWSHRPTRVDACEDWVEPGLFDRMFPALVNYAIDNGIKIHQEGDWQRGQGRTLYLGARESVVQLVLYEKGHQVGSDPAWVRLEVRVKPKGDARAAVADWVPGQAFGASQWLTEALACLGWAHLQAQSVGTVWRPSDAERSRAALIRQYGAILNEWAGEVGGWEQLGVTLGRAMRRELA